MTDDDGSEPRCGLTLMTPTSLTSSTEGLWLKAENQTAISLCLEARR